MTRATVDANVIASGVFGLARPAPISPPSAVLRAWYDRRFELVIGDHLLDEVTRTLGNSFFRSRIDPETVAMTLDDLRAVVRSSSVAAEIGVATHPEDDLVLATAVSAAADYLVTGDRQLLKLGAYEGVTIVSPRDFLDILDRRPSGNV